METKDTLSSCSDSEEQQMQQNQDKAKKSCMVNERQMQTTEENVDTSKALDASLVDTKSSGTESKEQDTSSRSGNDAHADDAGIRPIYVKEPMAEVQTTPEINVFATGQQHTKQPEFNNKGEVDQKAEQCHDKCPLPTKLTDNQITELSNLKTFASFPNEKSSDYDNSGPVPQLLNVSPSADTTVPSQQLLDLLFGPLYDEFFNAGTSSVNNSSSPTDNSKQQDTPPITNIQSSTEPTTPTNVNAKENNDNQAEDAQF
ncbi:hypothetical protein Tco_0154257 [Tanacetum coccineum]